METQERSLQELLDELDSVDATIRGTAGETPEHDDLLRYRERLSSEIATRRGEPEPTTRIGAG